LRTEHAYIATSPMHGRGLFAARKLTSGETLGVYPLLILEMDEVEALKATRLYHYVFFIDEPEPDRMRAAVAFGAISMCNHSGDANAAFTVDAAKQTVTLKSRKPISRDEEIFIDYEDFADEAFR
jgi:hypothetical protein